MFKYKGYKFFNSNNLFPAIEVSNVEEPSYKKIVLEADDDYKNRLKDLIKTDRKSNILKVKFFY